MRRRNAPRVRSSSGQVGSHGVRKSRLVSRRAAHSSKSVVAGVRSKTPSPSTLGNGSVKLMVRKNAIHNSGDDFLTASLLPVMRPGASKFRQSPPHFQARSQDRE